MQKSLFKKEAKKWAPWDYQKRAVKFLLEHAAAALLLDPGLGKTSISLAAFSFLQKRKVASKALVIAPLRACYQVWPKEADDWSDFNHLKVVVLHGPHKEERLQEEADVYVINPEGLEWLVFGGKGGKFNSKRWKALGFDTLIIDELTKFKTPSGVRFKALKLVLDYFARRWGLTGTPAANGLIDLFGQCFVLDGGRSLGQYISHYRMNYFYNPDGNGWKWVLRPGAKEQIYERLKPLALRMSAEDYLTLPEIVDVYVSLELPPSARRIYDALEDDLLAKIEDKVVVAANAAAAGGKLWQVCNGGLYVDDDVMSLLKGQKRGEITVHSAKIDYLEELVTELQGTPVLVAYQFEHDLHRLQERFGKDLPRIGGGNMKRDDDVVKAWNRNELPMVAAQQDAIAHALNMQEGNATHLFHYANTWNLETWDQIIRRIRRQGNTAKKVFRYVPIMKGTTDEDRRWSVAGKHKGQQALFDALLARRGRK